MRYLSELIKDYSMHEIKLICIYGIALIITIVLKIVTKQ
jgi:hypothetical protein